MYKAAKQTEMSKKVENSNVGFQRRANVASVWLVKDESDTVTRIIMPVHGSGLWDLMYGFLAVDADGETIRELIYYQQAETPGLGGEVQNPNWQEKWDAFLVDSKELYIKSRPIMQYGMIVFSIFLGISLLEQGIQ